MSKYLTTSAALVFVASQSFANPTPPLNTETGADGAEIVIGQGAAIGGLGANAAIIAGIAVLAIAAAASGSSSSTTTE